MLADTHTLSKDVPTAVATNTSIYTCRWRDKGASEYSVSGLVLPTERKLSIKHEVGKAGEGRHLTRFDRTEVDAYGIPATLGVYNVIVRPSNTAITNAIVIEELNRLIHLLIATSNANVTALLNGEV